MLRLALNSLPLRLQKIFCLLQLADHFFDFCNRSSSDLLNKRRKLVGGAVVAVPRAALAHTPGRLLQIGVLANGSWAPLEGLGDGLRDLGYVEGKTHLFVYRFAQGNAERFPALASELVNLPVDVIVSWGTPASLAAHKATDTIPIVMSA